ncbi:protein of unknown function [Salinimicrobium catena]|uniref:DUF4292 domain-containing protein n=1 Tax=Salinimicrobium catena TaxID=390640 RepID=A0A1H5ICS2_9FLAO|nr:DUF4292 domain-containing protein [Salinimicrobium catena]SDK76677.1 protein of unknown function [Salinimicrobium catena]SEE37992.1 protein of unknown function [Salinimicrobium catena]
MMTKKLQILLFTFALVLASCGSKKAEMGTTAPEDEAVAKVVANHYQNEVDFNTLQGKLNVRYTTEEKDQSVTVNFRMKKNDTIWMSGQLLGIPLAKVMITPNSVQFYEKIGKTYFDGDFKFLSELLGTPLDYQKVQNLILGQAIYDLREERYKLSESSRGYQLQPSAETFLKKLFLLDAGSYKALAQQIGEEKSNRSVTVTYPEYKKIGQQLFPGEIQIVANEGAQNTRIDMQFRGIDLNVPVSFPFSIPSGYEEIYIE